MKLTPLDIRHKEFRRSLRGYSEEDVDVFLDDVADEFERLFQQNIDMHERVERLEDQVAQFDGLKDALQKALVSAQQQADETRANAHKQAELTLRDAELKARDIINESYGSKQRVQQSLIQLRQVEEDFRFKFRSLLEAHLNLLGQDETSEERRRFQGFVSGIEEDAEQVPEEDASPLAEASAPQGAWRSPAPPVEPNAAETPSPASESPPLEPASTHIDHAAGSQAGPGRNELVVPDIFAALDWDERPRERPPHRDESPVRRFLFGRRPTEDEAGGEERELER